MKSNYTASYVIIIIIIIMLAISYSNCEIPRDSFQVMDNLSVTTNNLGVLINDNEEYTADLSVDLTLKPPNSRAHEMFISFDPHCSQGYWEDLKTNKPIELRLSNQVNTISVKYRSQRENESSCMSDSIIHDNIPPTVQFENQPNIWIKETNLRIGINVEDSGSGVQFVECDKHGHGLFETCGFEVIYDSLKENQTYGLVLKAKDKAGNHSDPKWIHWGLDQTSPLLIMSVVPSSITADITPDFNFISIDKGSGVARLECRLDSQTQFLPCQSQFSLNNLSDGSHRLEVRAVDNVGLTSKSGFHSWSQDTKIPTIQFTKKPQAISKEQTVTFQFSGINNNQGVVSYECQLNGGAKQTCRNPHTLTGLSSGQHSFSVVGFDSANNTSLPITYTWIIDRIVPTVRITSHPKNFTKSRNAFFHFTAQDSQSGVRGTECRLDGGAFETCQGLKSYINLPEGEHRFSIRAQDRAGNFSFKTVSWSIMVDTFTYYVGRPHILIPKDVVGLSHHFEGAFNVVKINRDLFRGYVANATTYLLEGNSLQNMALQSIDKKVIGEKLVGSQFYCLENNAQATDWRIRSRDCGTWLRYTEKYRDYIRGWAHVETNCCYKSNFQTYSSVAYVESQDNGQTFQFISNWPFFPQSSFPPEPRKFRGLEQVSLVNARGWLWAYMSFRPRTRTVLRAPNDDRAKNRIHWKKWLNGSWRNINDNGIQNQFSDYGAKKHGIYPGYDVKNDRFILVGTPLYKSLQGNGILLSTSDDGINFKLLNAPLVPKDPNIREDTNRFENFRSFSLVSPKGGNRYEDIFFLYYTYQRPRDSKHKRIFVYREIRQVRRNSIHEPTVKLALSRYEKNGDSWTTTTVPSASSGYRFVNNIGYILTEKKDGSIPLADCVIKGSQSTQHINRAHNRTSLCDKLNEYKIRTLGYIYPPHTTKTQVLIALYRCYNEAKKAFLTGTGNICNGTQIKQGTKIHLGYIFRE